MKTVIAICEHVGETWGRLLLIQWIHNALPLIHSLQPPYFEEPGLVSV
jgi:hypothetical protein